MKLFSKILILLLVFSLVLSGCNINRDEQKSDLTTVVTDAPSTDGDGAGKDEDDTTTLEDDTTTVEDDTTTVEDNTTTVEDETTTVEDDTTTVEDNTTTEDSTTEDSTTEESTTEESTTEESTTEESTTEESTTEESTTQNPEDIIDLDPEPGSEISLKSAIAIGLTYASNRFTTDKFYVRGKVVSVTGGTKANITIENSYGDSLYLYSTYGNNGESYSSMETKPQIGDVILVYGVIGQYQGTAEMKNGWIVEIEGSTGNKPDENDPYANMSAEEFYANYKPATSWQDAYWRSRHYFMSGKIENQYQAPTFAQYRPTYNGLYLKNYSMRYSDDGNTYYVLDENGNVAFEIYRHGAYVMLEEVAAYVFAFGDVPANYDPNKNASPSSSPWGKYLRVNKTNFSGSTSKYPYEPELPDITGCGGSTYYYEIDIGTMGTDCDPSYPPRIYNNGYSIDRGAARIVFGRRDVNGDGKFTAGEIYVFYTYNHYNDFQEYLNYEGGWGQMFGNITGGGTISSKYNYNPTPYVAVAEGYFATSTANAPVYRKASIYYIDTRALYYATRICA